MTAIETLIASYRQVNGFVASDGYEDKDEDHIVAAAEAELAELMLWKPMTPEEAEAAYDAAEAIPISDEEIEGIVSRVTDPTYRPSEPEHVKLAAKITQLQQELAARQGPVVTAEQCTDQDGNRLWIRGTDVVPETGDFTRHSLLANRFVPLVAAALQGPEAGEESRNV